MDDIHSRIKKIVKFFRNHNRVYVKFKHRFPVVLASIQQNDGILCTFVRDRHRNTKTEETESYMYALPNSSEALDYYDNIKNEISLVFLSLLEVNILKMQNCGNPFLPINIHQLNDQSQYREITKKVNLFTTLPNITVRINIKENRVEEMLKALLEDFIFKFAGDPSSSCDVTSLLCNIVD